MRVNTDPRTWITLPRPAQGPKFGFAPPPPRSYLAFFQAQGDTGALAR